jgi:hypothetical protein
MQLERKLQSWSSYLEPYSQHDHATCKHTQTKRVLLKIILALWSCNLKPYSHDDHAMYEHIVIVIVHPKITLPWRVCYFKNHTQLMIMLLKTSVPSSWSCYLKSYQKNVYATLKAPLNYVPGMIILLLRHAPMLIMLLKNTLPSWSFYLKACSHTGLAT